MSDFDITNKTISAFTMYKFLSDITKPFTEFPAYKQGLINEEGYFTGDEGSIPTFDLFVIYTKRLFNEIPNPATKASLNNFTASMNLFKESLDHYGLDSEFIIEGVLKEFVNMELLEQEAAGAVHANSMGGGFKTGQVGDAGELAGYDPPLFLQRRKKKKNPLKDSLIRRSGGSAGGY